MSTAPAIILSADSIAAIVQGVVAALKVSPVDDPMMSAKEVCAYLGMSNSSLHNLRKTEPLLAPTTKHPLRWTKRQLDAFKISKTGAVIRAASASITSPRAASASGCVVTSETPTQAARVKSTQAP